MINSHDAHMTDFTVQPKPQIYSYRRISSLKQAKGQGLEMQAEAEMLEEQSQKHGLPISDHILDDKGLSAYHGKHLSVGSLGWFIKAVESGLIAPGSILVIYSLDRFSRTEITNALNSFTALLSKGVRVYSVLENTLYTDGNTNNNETASLHLALATMVFNRSHGESKAKSQRTKHLNDRAIARHLAGERHPSGYAYSIQSGGNNVWWSDDSDGSVKLHEIYGPVAREICLKLIDGQSPYRIVRWLNDSGIECPIKRSDKRAPGAWSIHVIRRIHEHRALIGQKVFKGETLEGYYPPLLSTDEYYLLLDARTIRKRPKSPGNTSAISWFAGITQIRCRHCGAGVHMNTETTASGGKILNYRCSNHRTETKCPGWSKRAALIESAVAAVCIDKVWKPAERIANSRIPVIQGQIGDKAAKLDKLVAQSYKKNFPDSYMKLIFSLENELNVLRNDLEQAQVEEAAQQRKDISTLSERWRQAVEAALVTSNDDARLQMRELLRDSIQDMVIGRPTHLLDGKKKGNGYERFMIQIDVRFVDGTWRQIMLHRSGVGAITGIERDPLLAEAGEHLAGVKAAHLNTYAPLNSEDEAWLQEEFKGFPTNRETHDQ